MISQKTHVYLRMHNVLCYVQHNACFTLEMEKLEKKKAVRLGVVIVHC